MFFRKETRLFLNAGIYSQFFFFFFLFNQPKPLAWEGIKAMRQKNILWSDLCMKLIIKSRKRREEEEEEIDLGNAVSLKDIF